MKKASKVKPKQTGRPSKFSTLKLDQLKFLIEKGCTDEEICSFFKITRVTFWRYQQTIPEFCNTIKNWKKFADDSMERSLYQRGMGYSHESEEIFCAFGKVTRVKTIKHYAPDTLAAIIWLKNRRPEVWRENPPVALDPMFQDAQLEFVGVPNQKDPEFEKKYRAKYEQN